MKLVGEFARAFRLQARAAVIPKFNPCPFYQWMLIAITTGCTIQGSHALTFDPNKLWPAGTAIPACFLNGTAAERKLVADTANEWTKYGNIAFDFGEDDIGSCEATSAAPVRIYISPNESWSFIGNDSLRLAKRTGASISLGIAGQLAFPQSRRTVQHEFGHLLGFLHEQSSLQLNCADELVAGDRLEKWWRTSIARAEKSVTVAYDPQSVMTFNLPASAYKLGASSPCFSGEELLHLSELDKEGMAKAYPFSGSPTDSPTSSRRALEMSVLRKQLNRQLGLAAALIESVTDIKLLAQAPDGVDETEGPAVPILVALVRGTTERIVGAVASPQPQYIDHYRGLRYADAHAAASEAAVSDPAAAFLVASLYLQNLGQPFNLRSGIGYLERASALRQPLARTLLGFAHEHGLGGLKMDTAIALKHYSEGAQGDEPLAHHLAGSLYLSGVGVQADNKAAAAAFASAASRNFGPSIRALAILNDQGIGAPRDSQQALVWAKAGAALGDPICATLAILLELEQSQDEAAQIAALGRFEALAATSTIAASIAGAIYDRGLLNVTVDAVRSIGLYRRAATLGQGRVAFRLGELLLRGQPDQRAEGVSMVRKAADVGYVPAQLKLAEFFHNGLGEEVTPAEAAAAYPVRKDLPRALTWYRLASLYGSEPYKSTAETSIATIEEAIRRREWVAAYESVLAWVRRREGILATQNVAAAPVGAVVVPVEGGLPSKPKKTGSGALIHPRGIILTNNHVVEGCTRIRATVNGQHDWLRLKVANAKKDIATLEMTYAPGISAKFRQEPIAHAVRVIAMGYPEPEALGSNTVKTAPGEVTALVAGPDEDPDQFTMSATINRGNSGGPVFDGNGNLAGIVVARSEVASNTNFAIKGEVLRNVLMSRNVLFDVDKSPKAMTPEQVASPERLRTAVFLECF